MRKGEFLFISATMIQYSSAEFSKMEQWVNRKIKTGDHIEQFKKLCLE